jgi:hypothetical protein
MKTILASLALICLASTVHAQAYDYTVQRARATLTGQQMTDVLNQQSAAGWDFYTGVSDATSGDLIVVYRRPHQTTAATTAR